MALVVPNRDRNSCCMATTRIREFRDAADLTIEQLADAVGISVSQMSRIERDEREPRLDEILRISHRLGVAVGVLVGEDDGPALVPVLGRIGAGGAIDTSSEQLDEAEPLYEIELSFPLPDDTIAFEISGNSMWPRYDDGDVIVCSRHGGDIRPLVGFEAAIATEAGTRYLKRIIEGSRRGLYNLESHNAEPMRDIRVVWASEVLHVVRRSQVRNMTDRARRQLRKAVGS